MATVTATYTDATGDPATGTVYLSPVVRVGTSDPRIVTEKRAWADLDVQGSISIDVLASDDPSWLTDDDEVPYLVGDRSNPNHLELPPRQRLGSRQEEYASGSDLYQSPASVAMQRAFVPHGMGRTQELESTVIGEDSIRTRCLSNQEGIGQVSLGVESRWNRRIDSPGDGLDPSCGQVVLELIARGTLVSLVSAGGG